MHPVSAICELFLELVSTFSEGVLSPVAEAIASSFSKHPVASSFAALLLVMALASALATCAAREASSSREALCDRVDGFIERGSGLGGQAGVGAREELRYCPLPSEG